MARKEARKSRAEARVERLTWAMLVLVFVVLQFIPEGTVLPNFIVPAACAIILLGSGFYQFTRSWRVSPFLWIAGVLMAVAAGYSVGMNPSVNLAGVSLLLTFIVIVMGIVLDES